MGGRGGRGGGERERERREREREREKDLEIEYCFGIRDGKIRLDSTHVVCMIASTHIFDMRLVN
jgi:hypothetical protein